MSYNDFFGLNEQPFSNTPDSRFYFESQEHHQAMLRLMHAVDTMNGLALLVGDIGTGKTTLARKLLDRLDEKEYESALLVIVHSAVTPEWLLRKIALQMGVKEVPEGKVELLGVLFQRLLEIRESGRKAVVLVDEAQMLQSREILEEIRGLLNLEMPGRKMITFIFFALPVIDTYLSLDEPLKQRLALRYRLGSMKPAATAAYIGHRLKVAGCDRDLFNSEATVLIHRYSRGIPRLINVICDNALLEAFLTKQREIGAPLIEAVVGDLGFKSAPSEGGGAPPAGTAPPGSTEQRVQLSKEELAALDFLSEPGK